MAIFDELRQGVQEIDFLADPTAGEVRIGTTDGMMAGVFPAVLERLCRTYPKITFHVPQVAMTPDQYRQLRERKIDLILGRLVMPVDDDLRAEVLFYDRTLVVAGSHNPWCRRRNIKLAELADEPWAIPADGLVGALLAEAFRASGLDLPRAGVKSNSVQLAGALLSRGSHLTVLPASALKFSTIGSALKALPVKLDIPPWPTGIVTLKNRTISPVAQLFIDCARATTKPLARQMRA
jgi:DNA-binding transcriptional LysR family regulator